jgi:hypothetical protein
MIGGYLEVGLNDQNEIVINHPDLKPDENGVGHIVFSVAQALDLARLLTKHAKEAGRRWWHQCYGERRSYDDTHKTKTEVLAMRRHRPGVRWLRRT